MKYCEIIIIIIIIFILLFIMIGKKNIKTLYYYFNKDILNENIKIYISELIKIFTVFLPTILSYYLIFTNDFILDIIRQTKIELFYIFLFILIFLTFFTLLYLFENLQNKNIFIYLSILLIYIFPSYIFMNYILDYGYSKINYCNNLGNQYKIFNNLKNNTKNTQKIYDLEFKIDMGKNYCGNFKYEDEKIKDI